MVSVNIKLYDIITFFEDKEKIIDKGKSAVELGHVSILISDADLHYIREKLDATIKNREYNVEVEFDSGCIDC
nr:unnamed protein product [Callosobruchus chinensis]